MLIEKKDYYASCTVLILVHFIIKSKALSECWPKL